MTIYSLDRRQYFRANGILISSPQQTKFGPFITAFQNHSIKSFDFPLNDQDLFPIPVYFPKMTSRKWLDENQKFNGLSYTFKRSKKCPTCQYGTSVNPHSDSTPTDLILTVLVGYSTNAMTFVRTLRSTQCKASIVFLAEDKILQNFTSLEKSVFEKCSVTLINIGRLYSPYKDHIYEARHVLLYAFIKTFRKQFNRIYVADVFDIIFQSDPFVPEFNQYTMGFTTEGYYNNNDPTNNTKWIKVADPDYYSNPHFYDDKIVVNGGFYFGSTNGLLLFYKVFLSLPIFKEFSIETIDQGYMNYLFHKGIFASNGLRPILSYPGDYIVSARGRKFDPEPHQDGLYVPLGETDPPATIHQYNRLPFLIDAVKKSCPSLGPDDQHPFPKIKG